MAKVEDVPYFEEVRKEKKIHPILPKIAIVGCGGCGINITNSLANINIHHDGELQYHAMDTSESNAMQLNDKVKLHMVARTGSGKVRSTHVENVQKNLTQDEFVRDPADVNVIIFGFSGGSGSVIGPLIARDFALKEKAVVLVGVIDDCSRLDCDNSIKTFKTLDYMSEQDDLYFPIMLFDNVGKPRSNVDDSIRNRVVTLIEMLSSYSITEIDYTDKMNFLRPHIIECAPAGIFHLGVTNDFKKASLLEGEIGIDLKVGEKVHAVITVTKTGQSGNVLANVAYVGISDKHEYLSVIGIPIDKSVFDRLNQTQDKFKSLDSQPTTVGSRFKDQTAMKHQSNLVL